MPSEVFEDWIELSIGLLEAEAPNPSKPALFARSYPLPLLRTTGQVEKRKFRVITLENDHLIVVIAPDLGGRIVRLIDKHFNKDILPLPDALTPKPGDARGASLSHGIQVRLSRDEDRSNSMGSSSFQIEEAGDEGESAAVWIGEVDSGSDIGLTIRYSLSPDRMELECQVRAFNRSFRAFDYDPSVVVAFQGLAYFEQSNSGVLLFDPEKACGLALWPGDEPMDSASYAGEEACLNRFAARLDKQLGPRQLDVWSVRIQPLAGVPNLAGASPEAYFGSVDQTLSLRSIEGRPSHEVFLLAGGATLSSPANLSPGVVTTMALDQAPDAVLIRDTQKTEILRSEGALEELAIWSAVVADAPPPAVLPQGLPTKALQRAAFEPPLKHQAHLFLGMDHLAAGRFQEAGMEFESALLYNAEDHLTWWAKAAAARLTGDEAQDQNDLPNAHFLAPLEPLLRAEAFLGQPQSMDRDKSPLLDSLDENPESFVNVACQLIAHGLIKDSVRWIDEALRHQEMAMLHYLLAYCHLKGSGMAFEAAKEVQTALAMPLAPPYPWRPVELEALKLLAETYPADKKLSEMLQLTRLLEPGPAHKS